MQKYKPSPKAKAKAKTMAKAMPKPTMPKAKAVAKPKPTAQSVAKQRAEMLKKLSPAMREMKMGSKMVKCEDGTGKVKAPSMAMRSDKTTSMVAKRRGTITDAMKANDKKSYRNREDKLNIAAGRKGNTDYIVADAMANSNYYGAEARADKAAKDARKLKTDKMPMRNTYAYGTKGVKKMAMGMAEMPMGSKAVSGKYPDGTKKVKAPSTEMRGDKTATANTKRTDLRLNKKESEYYTLQRKRNQEREEGKGFLEPNGISIGYNDFGIDTEAKKAAYDKAMIKSYESSERDKDEETRQKQNALGARFKKRNEAMQKLSGKMSYGSKSVSKMKMCSKKVC